MFRAILFGVTLLFLAIAGASMRSAAQGAAPWAAEKILPAEPGRKACFARIYDAKHLRDHPKQKVSALIFFLRVSGYDVRGAYDFQKPDHIMYQFAMEVKRRNDKRRLHTSGDCLGSEIAQCVVDCDRGGVDIEKLSSGDGLAVRLSENGIEIGGHCEGGKGVWIKPGPDDKVFDVEPAPLEVCRPLEKTELNPWP
jgi:hypothetical protein